MSSKYNKDGVATNNSFNTRPKKPKAITTAISNHTKLLRIFSNLTLEETALLLDCVMHATVDTGYIENDTVNQLKDALSASLALGVIYQEVI